MAKNCRLNLSVTGTVETIECDLIVHGAGRTPNLDGLDLETANIDFDAKKGVAVDGGMKSVSNKHVYAAGDCAESGKARLTTTAESQGDAIVDSILNSSKGSESDVDYGPIAKAVFTVPPIASVGLTEAEAKEQGLKVRIESDDLSDSGTVRKVCQTHAAFKVLIDKESEMIVGAHLFGPAASETINVFTLAMAAGLSAKKLKSTLLAFPTFGYRSRSMV